jgi:hypothetical protein
MSAVDYAEAFNHVAVLTSLRMATQGRLLAARARRNLRLRRLRNERIKTFVEKMAARGITVTESEAEKLMKPPSDQRRTASHAHNLERAGDDDDLVDDGKLDRHFGHGHNIGGKQASSFAKAIGVFNKAGKAGAGGRGGMGQALLALAKRTAEGAPTSAVVSESKSVDSVATSDVPKVIAGMSLLANVGHKFEKGKPILAYESGDEDDNDLVEQIDYDFSVRSPWMTAVQEAHEKDNASEGTEG